MTEFRATLLSGLGRLSKLANATSFQRRSAADAVNTLDLTVFSDHLRIAFDLLKIIDAIVLISTGFAAEYIYTTYWHTTPPFSLNIFLLIASIAILAVMFLTGSYRLPREGRRAPLFVYAAFGLGLAGAVLFALNLLNPFHIGTPPLQLLLWLALAFVSLLLVRCGLVALTYGERFKDTVVVVGSTVHGERVVEHLQSASRYPTRVLGVFNDDQGAPLAASHAGAGTLDDLLTLGQKTHIRHVILAMPPTDQARIESTVLRLQSISVDISLCAGAVSAGGLVAPVDAFPSLGLVGLARRPLRNWNRFAKAAEDLVLGSLILIFVAPLMLTVSVLIKLDSRGPVLFRQTRHGLNNREISVLKFRSMYADNHDQRGVGQTQSGDPRITPIGRFLRSSSIDELPQIFNVLKGDMSLVGPRAHPVHMRTEQRLGQEIVATYPHRHRVKPGITGWAQVHGLRGATRTAEELRQRIDFDLDYIAHWSLWMDLKILVMTPLRLFIDKAE